MSSAGSRVVGVEDAPLRPQLRQVMAPRLLEALEEEVRAAQQEDGGHRRVALGQRGQVLVDHRLEQARDDLLDGDAGLDQRVRVGLGEDAALGADLVEAEPRVRHGGQPLGRHLELAGRLLDEGPGAPAARRLHEHLLRLPGAGGGEEDRLHVLAADLGHEPHLGVEALDAGGDGDDLLDVLAPDQGRDGAGARARDEDPVDAGREAGLGLPCARGSRAPSRPGACCAAGSPAR